MLEIALLTKVGLFINALVKGGYCLAGSYIVRTGVRYVQDYRDAVARENEVR